MKLQHIGTYVFNANLPDMGALEFAAHGYDTESRPFLEERKKKLASKEMSRKDRRALAKEKRKESKKKLKQPSEEHKSPNHL